jgi:hypothetical protein
MHAELRVPAEHAICYPLLIDNPWELAQMMIDHQDAAADRYGAAVTHKGAVANHPALLEK